jgi:signal transduction histidine kinase
LTESDFSIYDVLESVISNLYISASSKGLYIYYHVEEAIDHVYFGDSNRIQQILLHLISNAIKVRFSFY